MKCVTVGLRYFDQYFNN